jgi:hypothetical protein
VYQGVSTQEFKQHQTGAGMQNVPVHFIVFQLLNSKEGKDQKPEIKGKHHILK